MVNGYGLVAFRDRWGIRPLCYGARTAAPAEEGGPSRQDYAIASESVVMVSKLFSIIMFNNNSSSSSRLLLVTRCLCIW
jgi:amidophosphoribosyltransferase